MDVQLQVLRFFYDPIYFVSLMELMTDHTQAFIRNECTSWGFLNRTGAEFFRLKTPEPISNVMWNKKIVIINRTIQVDSKNGIIRARINDTSMSFSTRKNIESISGVIFFCSSRSSRVKNVNLVSQSAVNVMCYCWKAWVHVTGYVSGNGRRKESEKRTWKHVFYKKKTGCPLNFLRGSN